LSKKNFDCLCEFSVQKMFVCRTSGRLIIAGLAQLVEQLICNQQVAGSSPITSSKFYDRLDEVRVFGKVREEKKFLLETSESSLKLKQNQKNRFRKRFRKNGQMPEWLKGADCKSAGFGLRRFESFSVHQFSFSKYVFLSGSSSIG
jgi:hypothetical protein